MARRKKAGMLDDGSDSDSDASALSDGDGYNSQEDDDSRAERRLFERRHKRPRTGGKQAAWEGIFGEGDDPPPRFAAAGRGGRGGRSGRGARTDWTKAPSFVASGSKPASKDATPLPEGGEGDGGSDDSGSESDDTTAGSTREATPRVVGGGGGGGNGDGGEDTPPARMGMGMGMSSFKTFMAGGSSEPAAQPPPAASSNGRSGRMGLGAVKSMFDSGRKVEDERVDAEPNAEPEAPKEMPSAFGRAAAAASAFRNVDRERSNFTPKSASPAPAATAVPAHVLTNSERTHFSKISGSFGARMLANMGWSAGKGLGANEDGLAVPIAVKTMQRGQGITSGIRSEESKREARRKGELEEEEPKRPGGGGGRKKKGGAAPAARDGWKKEKRVKVKVEHKTYEQLIAEEDTTRTGVGLVLDARSGELKTVESLSELSLSTWTPSADNMQLPELRHNLRLILDVAKGEVGNLVKEGKRVNEARRWSTREEERARTKQESVAEDISRLETIQRAVKEISAVSDAEARRGSTSLEGLRAPFDALLAFKTEYAAMELDDVVVGAIDHVLAKSFALWQPFDLSSDTLLSTLKPWRKAFNLDNERSSAPASAAAAGTMTAWESLLWHRWLPKVRSAINNEWDPTDPLPAVHLFESWEPLLPGFLQDNLLDQLIMPKVTDAVERWRPKAQPHASLASIIFPWLPILGERAAQVLDEGKRRIKAALRKWNPSDGVISELERWKKDVFASSEWDKLMGEHVLPKLGAVLRDDLTINPRSQDFTPLHWVLPWGALLRASAFTRLLELEFFPAWLNVLYLWLVHPGYSGDEVAQWFELWKGTFSADALALPGVAHGFGEGLRLMDAALALGADAPTRLHKPEFQPLQKQSGSSRGVSRNGTPQPAAGSSRSARKPPGVPELDITFRSLAEDYIARADLLMVPTGKSHPTTGRPLFRVGRSTDRGGVVVYIGADAVFAQEAAASGAAGAGGDVGGASGEFKAVALEELVRRAAA